MSSPEDEPKPGTSSKTYQCGFRKVLQLLCPALALYENVKAATEKVRDQDKEHEPAVEAASSF